MRRVLTPGRRPRKPVAGGRPGRLAWARAPLLPDHPAAPLLAGPASKRARAFPAVPASRPPSLRRRSCTVMSPFVAPAPVEGCPCSSSPGCCGAPAACSAGCWPTSAGLAPLAVAALPASAWAGPLLVGYLWSPAARLPRGRAAWLRIARHRPAGRALPGQLLHRGVAHLGQPGHPGHHRLGAGARAAGPLPDGRPRPGRSASGWRCSASGCWSGCRRGGRRPGPRCWPARRARCCPGPGSPR